VTYSFGISSKAASNAHPWVCLFTFHGFSDFHAASLLGVESQSSNGNKGWDFFVTGEGSSDGTAASMKLSLDACATVTFDVGSTATARKAFGTCRG